MSFSIDVASRIEDVIFDRVIKRVSTFYVTAERMQPRWDGTTRVNFVLTGTRGNMARILINDYPITQVGIGSTQTYFELDLLPSPNVNYIRALDGTYDPATRSWTPTGSEDGISVVVSNLASVHYGVAVDYFKWVWVPYLKQNWSITGKWSSRQIEWQQRYHKLFPNTQALKTLAAWLSSRSTWNELPTERGVQDMVSALCATTPVVEQVSNVRSSLDFATKPLLPVTANYCGWEFNVWTVDIPTAKFSALQRLARNTSYLTIVRGRDPYLFVNVGGGTDYVDLVKDEESHGNLSWIFRTMGTMDSWRNYVWKTVTRDVYWGWWDNALDNRVTNPGLGWVGGNTLDSSSLGIFDVGLLDTREPWTELWDNLAINSADDNPDVAWDSVIQRAVGDDEKAPFDPPCWDWELTTAQTSCSTSHEVTNPLHGGAAASFVA